jgi:hypothetical protein
MHTAWLATFRIRETCRKGNRGKIWLRGVDLNHRPLGYEPNELPDCSTPHFDDSNQLQGRQTRELFSRLKSQVLSTPSGFD